MSELFTEKQWIGEFFVPGHYDKKFAGKLEYTPENGVMLSYSFPRNSTPPDSDVVYGILATGEKCTLVEKFPIQHRGITFKNGLTTHQGKSGFLYLLIGDHIVHDKLFFELSFSLTNMQEFFFHKGHKDFVKYSKKPLLTLKTSYGELEVSNNATFGFLHKDISAQIYSENETAQKELKECFETITAKHPDSFFMLKQDIAYHICLKVDAGATIQTAYNHIRDIANLFAILIYCPVCPERISIMMSHDYDHPVTVEVYPFMSLSKDIMNLCTTDMSHFHMPITNSKIDLASIFSNWLKAPGDYSTIVSNIQNDVGFQAIHFLHGEIVLYATQLEAISNSNGINNEQKYQYPIDTYGCDKIKNGLQKILIKCGETDIGRGISDLRNEIAHVGKLKHLLLSLSMEDIGDISRYLQMVIIGYVLTGLGVQKDIITEYQNAFSP